MSVTGVHNKFRFNGIVHDYFVTFDTKADKAYYYALPEKNFARVTAKSPKKDNYANLDTFEVSITTGLDPDQTQKVVEVHNLFIVNPKTKCKVNLKEMSSIKDDLNVKQSWNSDKPRLTTYDDQKWVSGNNPGYMISCDDCGYKKNFQLKNHVEKKTGYFLNMTDVEFTYIGADSKTLYV